MPGPVDQTTGDTIVADLMARALAWLEGEDVPDHQRDLQARALMRFHGQGGEIAVNWGQTPELTETRFRQAHDALYGFVLEAPIELVTIRVEAAGRTGPVAPPALEPTPLPAPLQTQKVHWVGSITETPIYDRDKLGKGAILAGPAILTQLDTTTLIAPGWTACVHSSGALILTKDVA